VSNVAAGKPIATGNATRSTPGAWRDVGFPRLYAVLKWSVVTLLVMLCVAAALFWTLILGRFAGSGFGARPANAPNVDRATITQECAWPYGINDHEAQAVCRLFYNMSPQERADVLMRRDSQSLR
jgi:hypothetical protein